MATLPASMILIGTGSILRDNPYISSTIHFITRTDYPPNDHAKYIRTVRLLRIRMKTRRNLLNHVKKLNKSPNWLWKREIF